MRDVSFSKATSPIIIFQIAIHFELLQADLISLLVVPGSILPPFPQESQMQVKSAQARWNIRNYICHAHLGSHASNHFIDHE